MAVLCISQASKSTLLYRDQLPFSTENVESVTFVFYVITVPNVLRSSDSTKHHDKALLMSGNMNVRSGALFPEPGVMLADSPLQVPYRAQDSLHLRRMLYPLDQRNGSLWHSARKRHCRQWHKCDRTYNGS